MIAKYFLIIVIAVQISSIKMTLFVDQAEGPRCFFQKMSQHQKYSLKIEPHGSHNYRLVIRRQQKQDWTEVLSKKATTESIEIHKYSSTRGVHQFCIYNQDHMIIRVKIQFMSGIQLGDFQDLVEHQDHLDVQQQIEELVKQCNKIKQIVTGKQDQSNFYRDIQERMSVQLVFWAIFGLIGTIFTNFLLFHRAKNLIKAKKLM